MLTTEMTTTERTSVETKRAADACDFEEVLLQPPSYEDLGLVGRDADATGRQRRILKVLLEDRHAMANAGERQRRCDAAKAAANDSNMNR